MILQDVKCEFDEETNALSILYPNDVISIALDIIGKCAPYVGMSYSKEMIARIENHVSSIVSDSINSGDIYTCSNGAIGINCALDAKICKNMYLYFFMGHYYA